MLITIIIMLAVLTILVIDNNLRLSRLNRIIGEVNRRTRIQMLVDSARMARKLGNIELEKRALDLIDEAITEWEELEEKIESALKRDKKNGSK